MIPTDAASEENPYWRLARSLDALPNRFPPAANGSDLRLLAKLFTPEEADLAACLQPLLETPAQIADRTGRERDVVSRLLKDLSRKGLILMGKTDTGRLGFGLMPFVVGFYEEQSSSMDAELARLFDEYFHSSFGDALKIQPQVHRVIPVKESIQTNMEVHPYESISVLLRDAQSWGVVDCICRKQKALVGEPCGHPLDVCMVLSQTPDAFQRASSVRPLTIEEAAATLQRAAEAGLVHCVSNRQKDIWYICNCCTCSCGVLRGMAELGIANVVAQSSFINRVDETLCAGCGECVDRCQFNALSVEGTARVLEIRCTGCGVCVLSCPTGALSLSPRAEKVIPPLSEQEWGQARLQAR